MQDYSTWLTKQRAAEVIGVSTKLVEKMAQENRLQMSMWRRPEGGPRIAVYHPDDVERERASRNPDGAAFVIPARSTKSEIVSSSEIAVKSQSSEIRLPDPQLVDLLRSISLNSHSSESAVHLRDKLCLTVAEAVAFSGLGEAWLLDLVEWRRIGPHGARVCRRADLEAKVTQINPFTV